MKRVTASEARRRWFSLLDEVITGEVVATPRKGTRVVLRREPASPAKRAKLPDYRRLLRIPDVNQAASWGCEWEGPGQLAVRERRRH